MGVHIASPKLLCQCQGQAGGRGGNDQRQTVQRAKKTTIIVIIYSELICLQFDRHGYIKTKILKVLRHSIWVLLDKDWPVKFELYSALKNNQNHALTKKKNVQKCDKLYHLDVGNLLQ